MPERFQWQSALANLGLEARALASAEEAGVVLRERRTGAQLAIRGDAGNAEVVAAVEEVLGLGLPIEPKTARRGRAATILWLGPDEWLAVLAAGSDSALLERFDAAFDDVHHAVVDVSHSRCVIAIEGPNARDVLMKGTNIDLHPRAFAPDSCVHAHLARCHMLLHRLDGENGFHVYVHRSFAVYAWSWLCDAAREYGVRIDASGK